MKSGNLGQRLGLERLLSGYDHDQFATSLRIKSDVLRSYETGEDRPGAMQIARAATVLDIPLSFFCYGDAEAASFVVDEASRAVWLSLPRPPGILSLSRFSRIQPVVGAWRSARARLDDDVDLALRATGMHSRMTLARQSSSRMVMEYCGAGHKHLSPCEGLLRIGRDIHEMPDREYGARASAAYVEVAATLSSRIESVRALVRTSSATLLNARYDRVLLPWRGRGGEVFVMGLSLRRELSIVG